MYLESMGFPGGSNSKETACNAGDPGSIPGSGRSLGEGNGSPLQYSCMENSMDRGAWQAIVQWGCKEPDMTEQLSLTQTYLVQQNVKNNQDNFEENKSTQLVLPCCKSCYKCIVNKTVTQSRKHRNRPKHLWK